MLLAIFGATSVLNWPGVRHPKWLEVALAIGLWSAIAWWIAAVPLTFMNDSFIKLPDGGARHLMTTPPFWSMASIVISIVLVALAGYGALMIVVKEKHMYTMAAGKGLHNAARLRLLKLGAGLAAIVTSLALASLSGGIAGPGGIPLPFIAAIAAAGLFAHWTMRAARPLS